MRFASKAGGLVLLSAALILPSRSGFAQEEITDAGVEPIPDPPAEETDPPGPADPIAAEPPPDRLPPPLMYTPPPAPGPTGLEIAIHPLLQEAEMDLATGRTAYARARTDIVSSVLPPQSPLRIRSDGLNVLARQRTPPSAPRPDPEVVLAPLLSHAELDLRMGQVPLAGARLRIVLEHTVDGSRLRARALRLWRSVEHFEGPPPAPLTVEEASQADALPTGDPNLRGVGEIVELYITTGLFGGLTGAFLPMVISDSTASDLTYTLTMVGGAAVLVVGVLTLDLSTTIHTGVPSTISAGLRIGLLNGVLAMGLDAAVDDWNSARAISWAWGGAALGLAGGLAVGFGLTPSVEDARFVESVGLMGGILGTAAAFMTQYEDPVVGLALSMIGLDVGVLTGVLVVALDAQPSTERTLFLDLGVLAGAGFGALIPGLYYVYSGNLVETWPFGLGMALGAATGFVVTYLVTDAVGMDRRGGEAPATVGLAPVEGGAVVNVSFAL